MSARFAAIVVFFGLATCAGASSPDNLVRLERWDGRAVLVPNRGPGQEYFRLDAVADWNEDAPRDFRRYVLLITLPDSRRIRWRLEPNQGPPSRRISVFVPTTSVRNLRPELVVIQAQVVDSASGNPLSNPLDANIDDFPHPGPSATNPDRGPFHWGRPMEGPPGQARALIRPGPDGFLFVRVPTTSEGPGFYIATTEATNEQVSERLASFDRKAKRSDDFELSGFEQPAINLSPNQAKAYLDVLSKVDRSGVIYRLPTRDEWLRAARAGQPTAFWWGDEPRYPEGANFLGPEPALMTDTTAPSLPSGVAPSFKANPWDLYHTFGNADEWATTAEGGFVRMGGNFRTEPMVPMPEIRVENPDQTGPDPFVGVRPVFDLEQEAATELIGKALQAESGLAGVEVAFDPDRGIVTLHGPVPSVEARRLASQRLKDFWFVTALQDELTMPSATAGLLAELGPEVGQPKRITPLGRRYDEYEVAVRWADRLPVSGSSWYVNVYTPGGQHYAHALLEKQPGGKTLHVLIDHSRMPVGGLPNIIDLSVGISLGGPAHEVSSPNLVSNLFPLSVRIR